jgi:hypothetical protein
MKRYRTKPCRLCGASDFTLTTGSYPCPKCGLPSLHEPYEPPLPWWKFLAYTFFRERACQKWGHELYFSERRQEERCLWCDVPGQPARRK